MTGQQIIGRVIAAERPERVWCERAVLYCGRGRARAAAHRPRLPRHPRRHAPPPEARPVGRRGVRRRDVVRRRADGRRGTVTGGVPFGGTAHGAPAHRPLTAGRPGTFLGIGYIKPFCERPC